MNELQNHLMSMPVLALPYADGQFTLDTDACNVRVESMLLQEQPEKTTKPARYWSRSVAKPKHADDTTRRKCLPIVWPVLILMPYLEENQFIIQTDHDCLKWIRNLADATGRLARLRLHLFEFEFDAVHRAEIEHQAADALSSMPTDGADITLMEVDILIVVIDVTSHHNDEIPIQQVSCHATTYIVGDNDNLQDGAANATTFEKFYNNKQRTLSGDGPPPR